jgi:thioester reductase-like protein
MDASRTILLTGATGLLGRYLLRDLLLVGQRLAVLVRPARTATAAERVAELLAFWSERLGRELPSPVILEGELQAPGLGLTEADRRWLARHCSAILHAAARVAFRRTLDGEPWQTNVEGTRRLLHLCQSLGLSAFHYVSTAFVCGDRTGAVYEDELECGQRFHNEYEQSKFESERLVRHAPGVRATVYRPSVIVGDSRTGYTSSYHGFYRFLELPVRLAALQSGQAPAAGGSQRRVLPLRVPLSGAEARNLVPVDWVAQAVVQLIRQPAWHAKTYHLVAPQSVPARHIKKVAEELLGIDGVRWAGHSGLTSPTSLEEAFRDHLREYWPYFTSDPVFDCRNMSEALPELPPPSVDRPMLARLIRFAVADQWGRTRPARRRRPRAGCDCATYIEQFFPAHAQHSELARALALDLAVALDIRGAGGGQWSCRWMHGALVRVTRGLDQDAIATYGTDVATFDAIVHGELAPQEAFFTRRIAIEGDLEKALKLAVLFGQFVREFPYQEPECMEVKDAAPVSG